MIGSSKNNRENFPRKCFWTQEKETWDKFNPRVSTNWPSYNWAWAQNTTHHKLPLPSLQETGFGLTASQEVYLLYTVGDSLYLNQKLFCISFPQEVAALNKTSVISSFLRTFCVLNGVRCLSSSYVFLWRILVLLQYYGDHLPKHCIYVWE